MRSAKKKCGMHKTLKQRRLDEMRLDPGRGGCGILALAELVEGPSHGLLRDAIAGLSRLEHRGGTLDGMGDGAGLLLKVERSFFERFLPSERVRLDPKEPLIVGTVFFLHGERNVPQLQREIDLILRREGLRPLGWRAVPTDLSVLGTKAREDAPLIHQLFVAKGHRREVQLFEALHRVKVVIEAELPGLLNVVSLAPKTTVYKALASADQLADFYLDFKDPAFVTSAVIAHRRFSTNTFTNWNLIQPFRNIAHNGEINTITANCRAISDADSALSIGSTLMNHGSDSAQVDRVVEMMSANGMTGMHEALRRMIPPAWTEDVVDGKERRFFEANRRALGTIGAWEGPIAIVGTDGLRVVAILDRMGLRPLRYLKTARGRVIVASEMGVISLGDDEIVQDGQLEPGQMLIADLGEGVLVSPEATTQRIIDRSQMDFQNLSTVGLMPLKREEWTQPLSIGTLNAFGWTEERVKHLQKMRTGAKEPVYGMGNDSPLAIFSENHSRLYSFLHQIVAVVTNPPIDPLREGGAIDTTVYLGRSPRLTRKSDYQSWPQYELKHPILTNEELSAICSVQSDELRTVRLDATFSDTGKSREIVRRIHDLTDEALTAIRSRDASILVISDIEAMHGERLPLPMLLVVSAVHQALAEKGLRRDVSIVAEAGDLHEGHDCSILLAYGATAINPYAMLGLARADSGMDPDVAVNNVVDAIVYTLKRVMSKMGITTIAGYRGSALFEAVGISSDVVEYFMPDTVSRLGGMTMDDIYANVRARFSGGNDVLACNRNVTVFRREVTDALQMVARNGNANGDYDRFVSLLKETPPIYLRDMLEFRSRGNPVPLDRVAGAGEIIRTTIRAAAMSHGALNATSHRAIAAAFNRFDSRSSSGEGGEDERRDRGGPWEEDRSRIRQIASGRFGVDARYLAGADEIEIKIGQGAKPGEGGHLPGHKVNEEIARIRKTRPGIDLISPPPHHDIYSIEDLKQLITNLRELHPKAIISVKVPSVTGLGTIGVGIVKAGADVIVVSGFEGGTGAASSSSITHAGLPLDRGLSELHQHLVVSGVRSRVRVRADGGIKSGLDVAKVLALGADEVSIGTPLLIAERCIFCRGCSKGQCPVGIATHDEARQNELFMRRNMNGCDGHRDPGRARYEEARDGVINYLESLAEEVRRIVAGLGFEDPSQLVGRVDLLQQVTSGNPRWDRIDLSELLIDFRSDTGSTGGTIQRPSGKASALNETLVRAARDASEKEDHRVEIALAVTNSDHAIGATLAGEIATNAGRYEGKRFEIRAEGNAGQGFGFGAVAGMSLRLSGYANDGVGESMGGGARIIVTPPHMRMDAAPSHLVGNAAAYGATGGRLSIAGKAGQRFGVRNSGAILICEGVGKYAFEYMTGGVGIVLGSCGPCIGSGMTGGELFLYRPEGDARFPIHTDMIVEDLSPSDADSLREMLGDFFEETKSPQASAILTNWSEAVSSFVRLCPRVVEGKG